MSHTSTQAPTATLIEEIRSLVQDPTATPERLAEVAVQAAKAINDYQEVLDLIKPVLRVAAAGNKSKHVNWTTPSGSTSVTFPDARWVPRKDVDWTALRGTLGPVFDLYFTAKTTYEVRKDIDSVLRSKIGSAEPTPETSAILAALERDEPTPRVGFKPL